METPLFNTMKWANSKSWVQSRMLSWNIKSSCRTQKTKTKSLLRIGSGKCSQSVRGCLILNHFSPSDHGWMTGLLNTGDLAGPLKIWGLSGHTKELNRHFKNLDQLKNLVFQWWNLTPKKNTNLRGQNLKTKKIRRLKKAKWQDLSASIG